ncbi:MAG TPA: GNAT family N-acetyltransferase [Fastidiosipila sp.]|nr:GNAT family N-acetyltransferase [Fastidiosipila sp.]
MIEVNVDNIVLETKHLILRAFRADDLSDFNAYASDPGVGEMAGWTHHKDLAESQRILEILMAEKKAFALELKATSQVIGSLGIEYLPAVMPQAFHGLVGRSLGYVLGRKWWGRGLVPEAVDVVVEYCFNDLDLDFLTCTYYLENRQSKRVTEKCGFKPVDVTVAMTRWGEMKDSMLTVRWNPRAGSVPHAQLC